MEEKNITSVKSLYSGCFARVFHKFCSNLKKANVGISQIHCGCGFHEKNDADFKLVNLYSKKCLGFTSKVWLINVYFQSFKLD